MFPTSNLVFKARYVYLTAVVEQGLHREQTITVRWRS